MKITTNEVRSVVAVLDSIIDEYRDEKESKKRDWRTYEQQLARRLQMAMEYFHPLVIEAVESMEMIRTESRGRKSDLTLTQKVELLLILLCGLVQMHYPMFSGT
jgi:hypothetical protein